MSLVFAAITPHPPMLIPGIGKSTTEQLAATKSAFEKLEQELYLAKPNIILIISPHSSIFSESFSVNAHDKFTSAFDQFGDFTTKKEWYGSPDFAALISKESVNRHIPVQLVSQENLDHGAAVALYFLTNHLPDAKVVPLGYSALPRETHIGYGEMLKDIIFSSNKRIAVIASGDLSHCVSPEAPNGAKPAGKEFDDTFINLLETGKFSSIFTLDQGLTSEADECGYRSSLILLSILKNINCRFHTLSYEHPFGIGYLVGNFIFD
jgi:AmmeMemoRadiSam system protein B